jgi:hypothetical protein
VFLEIYLIENIITANPTVKPIIELSYGVLFWGDEGIRGASIPVL